MSAEWQSLAAAGVVIITAMVLLWRLARRPRAGCGGGCSGCGCGGKRRAPRR